MQKIICLFFRYSQFQSTVTKRATPIFYFAHPKHFQLSFNLHEFIPASKKSGNSICLFLRYIVDLESREQIDQIHILTMPNQKLFVQLSSFVNLYKNAKNEAVASICSADIVDLKILQSDWLRAFWPISHEQVFSQIQDLCRNTANSINFHYRNNSVKIIDQIFLKFKKPYFGPFLKFLGQKMFSRTSGCHA